MRAVIQRVSRASVSIDGQINGRIGPGLLILLGIETEDTEQDVEWLVKKIPALRIFNDTEGKMNLSLLDIAGEALVVSQFTLYAETKKGNRPSFVRAARPEQAVPLYEELVRRLSATLGRPVPTGRFGADMQVELLNDGPVTIIMDTK
jgi:D-tyrosyl-tRNA(Tyr) deacylase